MAMIKYTWCFDINNEINFHKRKISYRARLSYLLVYGSGLCSERFVVYKTIGM